MSECDADDGRAVVSNDDLRVERGVADLADAEDVFARFGVRECKCTDAIGELFPEGWIQRDDAETDRFAGFGAKDRAAD